MPTAKNPALSSTTIHGNLTLRRVSEKTNEPITKETSVQKDGRTEGRKDGWTKPNRTLPVTAGGPTIHNNF